MKEEIPKPGEAESGESDLYFLIRSFGEAFIEKLKVKRKSYETWRLKTEIGIAPKTIVAYRHLHKM